MAHIGDEDIKHPEIYPGEKRRIIAFMLYLVTVCVLLGLVLIPGLIDTIVGLFF